MKLNLLFAVAASAATSFTVSASTWWVNVDNYGKSNMTGTESAAFGTIQEAVEKAASGDTIKVKPGTYDQGETFYDKANSRVVITKSLRLESTDGKEVTHIVGRHSDTGTYGDDAVRCVYARTGTTEPVKIIGFTIRDGQAPADKSDGSGMGGGLYAGGLDSNVQLVDCTVANCWASRGAGLCGGCAIRTLIAGNRNMHAHGGIATSASLYNCVATGCWLGKMPALQGCRAVNCTFFGNATGSMASGEDEAGVFRNCIFLLNEGTALGEGPYRDLRGTVLAGPYEGEINTDYGVGYFISDASPYQMFAPAAGDLRPTKGSAASTNGVADIMYDERGLALAVPDEEDRYLDFYKNPIPRTGRICAGAVQDVAPAPVGGAITLAADNGKVFGYPVIVSTLYIRTATYPELVHLTPSMFVGGTNVYAYNLGAYDARYRETLRSPMMDGSFYCLPPPAESATQQIRLVPATVRYYVNPDPEIGSDDNDGLTPETPFFRLQKAVDSVPAGAYATVFAAAGLYGDDQGTTVVGDSHGTHPTRVVVPDNKYVRLVGAGKGLSVIEGKVDTTTGYLGGCGPNAVRCVKFGVSGVLQGFTIKNGFTGWDGNTGDYGYTRGGAVYGETYTLVSDCVITNASAHRGTLSGGGYSRCEFYELRGQNTGIRSAHFLSSCQFANCFGTGSGPLIYNDVTLKGVVHCSINNGDGTYHNTYSGVSPAWNTAVWKGAKIEPASSMAGCVFYGIGTITATEGYTVAYPQYVEPQDLRPFIGSPLETAGAKPTADNFGTDYYKYVTTDLNGRTWKLNANGAPMVGCYARPVTRVEPSVQSLGTITPADTTALNDGESLTVTYTPDATHPNRPYLGFAVNGELVAPGTTTFTLTAPGADEEPQLLKVEAVSSTNWYVNAAMPDDSGDGFSPETAKRTLAGVMSCDILSGDCVHAAAGDYNEGTMNGLVGASCPTVNRVEIKNGVALVADEGPEVTYIRGRRGEGCDAKGLGGTGAVRCVFLQDAATVKGFMLVDGCTAHPSVSGKGAENEGGGVCANSKNGIVYGCVITNCVATRGGGINSGTAINCRFTMNYCYGSSYGSAGEYSNLIGCYIGPQGNDNSAFRDPAQLDNCTIDGGYLSYLGAGKTFHNCVFKNVVKNWENAATLQSCVLDVTSTRNITVAVCDESCVTGVGDLRLDACGRPSVDSPVVDAGSNVLLRDALGVDLAGGPRVYNGTVDAGAYEYDWRPLYSAALGAGVTVMTASPGVTLDKTTGKVKLVDGATLTGTWSAESETRRAKYAVTAEASGVGMLAGELACEGKVDETFALVGGAETRKFKATGADLDFAFGFTGDGYGLLSDFVQQVSGLFLFVR